jgi:hypothetical protein
MRVIVLMAGITAGWSLFFVEMPRVAALASRCPMSAEQRVLGIPLMVEEDGFPDRLVVTLPAVISEIGSMNVVFLVTAKAVRRRLVFIERSLVATLASCFSMVAL